MKAVAIPWAVLASRGEKRVGMAHYEMFVLAGTDLSLALLTRRARLGELFRRAAG